MLNPRYSAVFHLTISGVLLALAAPVQGDVSIRSLLAEMPDMRRLASTSSPAYTTRQESSYDRTAKSPEENWFANRDFGNYLRVERRQGRNEHVMAELKGPGAVVRIWSANPQGTIRFYVDGQTLPEFIVNMEDLLSGRHPDFPPPFSGRRSGGANLYYPIPYQRNLKRRRRAHSKAITTPRTCPSARCPRARCNAGIRYARSMSIWPNALRCSNTYRCYPK